MLLELVEYLRHIMWNVDVPMPIEVAVRVIFFRQISRQRKEFEYHLQRHVKKKEDFTQYIAYELTLLQNISERRKTAKLNEKKQDIEYAIAKRLNKVFKQFIYRFQNEVEIYFEYLKFCKSVGFNSAASGIIGQMLQVILKASLFYP